MRIRSALAGWVLGWVVGASGVAHAHDVHVPLDALRREVRRVEDTLEGFRARPALPPVPKDREDHLMVLGNAEVEMALGNKKRALELLMGRLADPSFVKMPEYVDTLLLTSQILEQSAEEVGALHYSAVALATGGTPEQMAEAGARWFRIARNHQRYGDRVEKYETWKRQGGEQAAGTELSAEVMYQVAFALKADRKSAEARALLQRVPSESAFGSRSAYLAGVVFVEEGDLANAERWFSAIMEWPVPALPEGHPQLEIEAQVRALAAMSAGRLRYESGALEEAARAYELVPAGSPFENEACWERAYLDLERGVRRGALKRVQCVLDLGASGSRHVDAQLFRASLLAHLSRYADSVEAYKLLNDKIHCTRDMYVAAMENVGGSAEFLFQAMERNAVDRGADATPGPPTLFADAWTPDVDRAYRVDRGLDQAALEVTQLVAEVDFLTGVLSKESPFVALELRRKNLEALLREIRHLEGHAAELTRHGLSASAAGTLQPCEGCERDEAQELGQRLAETGREVEREITAITQEAESRQHEALSLLTDIKNEAQAIAIDLGSLEGDARAPVNAAADAALAEIRAFLADASMRAEFGVLDTFWLKKEHRTQAIEALVDHQKETEAQVLDAIQELSAEEAR